MQLLMQLSVSGHAAIYFLNALIIQDGAFKIILCFLRYYKVCNGLTESDKLKLYWCLLL